MTKSIAKPDTMAAGWLGDFNKSGGAVKEGGWRYTVAAGLRLLNS